LYDQNQQVKLSDAQYAGLPTFIVDQLIVVQSIPDPIAAPPVDSYVFDLLNAALEDLGVPLFLQWDGLDYQPSAQKNELDRVKVFVNGPDPHQVSGVVLNPNDLWVDTS